MRAQFWVCAGVYNLRAHTIPSKFSCPLNHVDLQLLPQFQYSDNERIQPLDVLGQGLTLPYDPTLSSFPDSWNHEDEVGLSTRTRCLFPVTSISFQLRILMLPAFHFSATLELLLLILSLKNTRLSMFTTRFHQAATYRAEMIHR